MPGKSSSKWPPVYQTGSRRRRWRSIGACRPMPTSTASTIGNRGRKRGAARCKDSPPIRFTCSSSFAGQFAVSRHNSPKPPTTRGTARRTLIWRLEFFFGGRGSVHIATDAPPPHRHQIDFVGHYRRASDCSTKGAITSTALNCFAAFCSGGANDAGASLPEAAAFAGDRFRAEECRGRRRGRPDRSDFATRAEICRLGPGRKVPPIRICPTAIACSS